MDQKERFLKIYANIPLSLRKEAVLVMDDEPLTWNAAYIEVFHNTENSREILKKLEDLGII
jgi:predicted glycosyltransferase